MCAPLQMGDEETSTMQEQSMVAEVTETATVTTEATKGEDGDKAVLIIEIKHAEMRDHPQCHTMYGKTTQKCLGGFLRTGAC